jgi:hypothetical protein
MTSLRQATIDAGIFLDRWDGAGRIAHYMLKTHGARRRADLERKHQKGLLTAAHAAYYGGRFEVTRLGHIDEPVIEADINSAYPAGLQHAPCHVHGRWRKTPAATLQKLLGRQSALFVAPVAFHHPKSAFLCGLPFRQDSGTLMWPRDGRGTYWSTELRSARALGCRVTIEAPGWLYERHCECRPYEWLHRYYDARRALGKAHKGIPIKLGINSVYGKLAQRVGNSPWQNPIDAGLATAWTRAQLNLAAAAAGPRNVVMLATDAFYLVNGSGKECRPPLTLVEGDGLGQWDVKIHKGLFIAQPGLYWAPRGDSHRVKTRGISPKFFAPMVPQFHRAWSGYLRRQTRFENSVADILAGNAPVIPYVIVKTTIFVGIRLAMHRRAYGDLCRWLPNPRMISFDWKEKRGLAAIAGRSLILQPKPGNGAVSIAYTPQVRPNWIDKVETSQRIDDDLAYEAMPDPIELGPPFK